MISLRAPWLLLLALLVLLALWVRRRRGAASVLFAPGALLTGLPRSWRVRLLPVPRTLQVLGLLLTVVALARPVERVPLPHRTEGIDIVLCLDTSSSMTAHDLDPQRTRLDVAKEAAARFLAGRPDDRIGLVCFARFPDVRCPPTRDHRALGRILADVTPVASDGPEDATGIGTAVARAAQVLRGGGAKSKVVILLTDGEENVATVRKPEEIAPLHAGQLCRELGVRVYAIAAGLGSRNPSGEWVAVDTRQIRRLAERTDGTFFTARDAGAVSGVYGAIDALEKVAFKEARFQIEERFLPVLLVAVALLLASRLLQATVLAVLP
ncbi:MAG: VWA domain-containing protein [Planctomycetota bacterium]|jgi:Ca-activated chloride channel family protein